ncbi:ethanolamine ammonia-lyase light chain EutC, partial [Vibrio parahaemolyticus]
LRRPDLGRQLDPASRDLLAADPVAEPRGAGCDVVFVIADGLSAAAIADHAVPLLDAVWPRLNGWTVGPVVLARQARVALGDEIAALLGARL